LYRGIEEANMDGSEGITKELARAQFTEEMLAEMRALIGTQLRTEACLSNEYATRSAIQRFCEGSRWPGFARPVALQEA
jgi:hypothetical protein